MQRKSFFLAILGLVSILALPPVLLLLAGPSPVPDGPQALQNTGAVEPLKALIESRSTLATVYDGWEARYVARGGDHDVEVRAAWVEGLSTEPSAVRARVHLDLLSGAVSAHAMGLTEPVDLWLVDNQPGAGRSVKPEAGDRFAHLGSLVPDAKGSASLSTRLGEGFFRDFELDMVVVSRGGETPVASRLAVGGRDLFERLYTRTRLAAERAPDPRAQGSLRSLLANPLGALLGPRAAFADSTSVLVGHKLIGQLVGDGGNLFLRGTFSGNGRTCGTCHGVADNQTVDPAFIATLPSTDKLFIAEFPASQGGVPGLERPALMRQFGLILENVDGREDPTHKFVMRSTPHSLSLSTSILAPNDGRAPVQRTGWSGDAAAETGALRFFPVGATTQHFPKTLNRVEGVDFVLPTDAQLDAMEAFMLACGRLNDLNLSSVSLSEPAAQNGRAIFTSYGKCNGCHSNAGALVPGGANENYNVGVEQRPHPARTPGDPQFVEDFPLDGGFGKTPFDTDGDGVDDSFGDGTFNVPPLVEAADTAPYFHNHPVATLEEAVKFFSGPEFNASPAGQAIGGIHLTDTESEDVAAFLRVLNAAFNIDIAIQRTSAAIALENSSGGKGGKQRTSGDGGGDTTGSRQTADGLLALANIEAVDAIDVLGARGLNPTAVSLIQSAIVANQQAMVEFSSSIRKSLMLSAQSDLQNAKADLGSGMSYVLGEGNLMF